MPSFFRASGVLRPSCATGFASAELPADVVSRKHDKACSTIFQRTANLHGLSLKFVSPSAMGVSVSG
jgi:hypothetical protein